MELLEETEGLVYVPTLGDRLTMLVAAYGALPVLLGAILMALIPRRRRLPPPPEPEIPVYGPVGFVHFD